MITDKLMMSKQIPFSLEMAKKIQAGEIKGTIKTRDGEPARFLGELNNKMYPLVFALGLKNEEMEVVNKFTIDGKYFSTGEYSNYDIILEIEEPKQECQFKPFDKVLVRQDKEDKWEAAFFSHIGLNIHVGKRYYIANNMSWEQCIPYAGNENLVGTTNKPK